MTMLPPEIVNRICDFLTIAELKKVVMASSELWDAVHESTYKNAVLKEHPLADSLKQSWASWKDLFLNIDIYSRSWYPHNDREDGYSDNHRHDSSDNYEERWVEEHAVDFWLDDL